MLKVFINPKTKHFKKHIIKIHICSYQKKKKFDEKNKIDFLLYFIWQ